MKQTDMLYHALILDHNKNPFHFGKPASYTKEQEGFNPVCGDHYHIYIQLNEDGKLENVHFTGQGCALSKASASMMAQLMHNKDKEQVLALIDEFHGLITHAQEWPKKLAKLEVFSQIWHYPARVKCVTLAWHTLKQALTPSTESSII